MCFFFLAVFKAAPLKYEIARSSPYYYLPILEINAE
jgi:hypothetical protein